MGYRHEKTSHQENPHIQLAQEHPNTYVWAMLVQHLSVVRIKA